MKLYTQDMKPLADRYLLRQTLPLQQQTLKSVAQHFQVSSLPPVLHYPKIIRIAHHVCLERTPHLYMSMHGTIIMNLSCDFCRRSFISADNLSAEKWSCNSHVFEGPQNAKALRMI